MNVPMATEPFLETLGGKAGKGRPWLCWALRGLGWGQAEMAVPPNHWLFLSAPSPDSGLCPAVLSLPPSLDIRTHVHAGLEEPWACASVTIPFLLTENWHFNSTILQCRH
jgi:hypothetical protein